MDVLADATIFLCTVCILFEVEAVTVCDLSTALSELKMSDGVGFAKFTDRVFVSGDKWLKLFVDEIISK